MGIYIFWALSGSEEITRAIPLTEWKIIFMLYLLFLEYQI